MVTTDSSTETNCWLDAAAVLRSPSAMAALAHFAATLRAVGYRNKPDEGALACLALGQRVQPAALGDLLDPADLDALCRAGAADRTQEGAILRFVMFAAGQVLAVVPRLPAHHPERVYLGPDSISLLGSVWRLAPGGDLAVDLGTGTGYLAAVLLQRYRTVVATDVLATTSAVAALTLAINRGDGCGASLVADVTAGLRAGCADLVTANTPWVPAPEVDNRTRLVFAEGGPTGSELPMRFVEDGAALIKPGGLGIFQCLDVPLPDGSRPLASVCGSLIDRGFVVETRCVSAPGHWQSPKGLSQVLVRR